MLREPIRAWLLSGERRSDECTLPILITDHLPSGELEVWMRGDKRKIEPFNVTRNEQVAEMHRNLPDVMREWEVWPALPEPKPHFSRPAKSWEEEQLRDITSTLRTLHKGIGR